MREFVMYYLIWATAAGVGTGIVAYRVANPEVPEYKPSLTRATTVTGRGQFKCQTGC